MTADPHKRLHAATHASGGEDELTSITEIETDLGELVAADAALANDISELSDALTDHIALELGDIDTLTQAIAALGAGVGPGFRFIYSSNTTLGSDPGTGIVRFDSATLSATTALNISETDADGGNLATWIQVWDDSTSVVNGLLVFVSQLTPTNYLAVNPGNVSDNGAWDSTGFAFVASNGSFTNNESLRVIFVPAGDKGTDGVDGVDGADAPSTLFDLTDVADTADSGSSGGEVLTWNDGAGEWQAAAPNTRLDGLTDVSVTEGPGIDGQVLTYDDGVSSWVAAAPAGATYATDYKFA